MIEIITAPDQSKKDGIKIFIAGGITNCENWQFRLTERLKNDTRLKDKDVIIFNPRCKEIPEEEAQVKWEYKKLRISNIISFWFSEGSLNPITLLEYGSHFKSRKKKIVVGCHPNYERKSNVRIQTKLAKPKMIINEDFDSFYEQIIESIFLF